VKLDNKFGCVDTTGTEVIPLQYDNMKSFENIFGVELGEKWGFIDLKGNEILPIQYEQIGEVFADNLLKVQLNGQWGFIDKDGNEVIPCQYVDVGYFKEGLINVRKNAKENGLSVRRWGYIDATGKEIIPLKYSNAEDFSEGRASVFYGNRWGFIDHDGNEVIPFQYSYTTRFIDGLALVGIKEKYGFIDRYGNEITPLKYDNVAYFRNGFARVKINDKWGFIDRNGNEITPIEYKGVDVFSEGRAAVYLNDKWGYIDTTGMVIIPSKYIYPTPFYKGRARVTTYRDGFIDYDGNEIPPIKYDDTYDWTLRECLTSDIKYMNGKWGYFNLDSIFVKPRDYNTFCFQWGYVAVELNEKWGFIDIDGNEVIPFKYEYAESFFDGFAIVYLDGKTYKIDENGNETEIDNFSDYSCADSELYTSEVSTVKDGNFSLLTNFLAKHCSFKDGNPTHQDEADEVNFFVRKISLTNITDYYQMFQTLFFSKHSVTSIHTHK
jgi:hypothetical protein